MPDLWEKFQHYLPLLGSIGLLLAYVAFVVVLLWAPKLRPRWLRVSSRVLGVAGIVPLFIAVPALFLGIALSMGDPPEQSRVFPSHDGRHEAKLNYNAGFLGRDYTEVTLKSADSCRHTRIFWHAGPSELSDTDIQRLDAQHLSITYRTRPDDPWHCEKKVAGILVACRSLPWPDTPTTPQSPPAKE